MKIALSLKLQSSLMITNEMRLAIQMLAMNSHDIEALINDELAQNPCLREKISTHETYSTYSSLGSHDYILENAIKTSDFREYLLGQIGLERFNSIEKIIAEKIIYNLEDDGILHDYEAVRDYLFEKFSIWPEWIESVRKRIMNLDPVGCAACSIKESLLIQNYNKPSDYTHDIAELLQDIDKQKNIKINNIDRKIYKHIKLLHTRPAHAFKANNLNFYAAPDLIIIKNSQEFYVALLKNYSHNLLCENFNSKNLIKSYNRAHFFIKSLRFRENSLQRIAYYIVEYQAAWFFHGEPLKPMTLAHIANKSGFHESSVSRLVRDKFIATQTGIFELKYFFSSAVKSTANNAISSLAAKNLIKKLIKEEDSNNPLSDQIISNNLKIHGIFISRRTVAKYRQNLKINGAHKRKRLALGHA